MSMSLKGKKYSFLTYINFSYASMHPRKIKQLCEKTNTQRTTSSILGMHKFFFAIRSGTESEMQTIPFKCQFKAASIALHRNGKMRQYFICLRTPATSLIQRRIHVV
mmetsp:Transcript_24089/g.34517  ORF Transcript_24089/g.34517 Transcript_24089/m.34517 type:complete len:107 (+) Transcript_24089:593-913(+)